MELEHRFEVPVGIDTAWEALLDMEKVGPCFPGASLDKVDGDEFSGAVKIKLGPIQLTYQGKAKIVEKDVAAHRAKIEATGNAARSASTAAMMVTATATALTPNRTAVDLVTTLSITGRPAQFGRGVMVEVGNKLIGQFADCVSQQLAGKPAGGAELVDVVNPDEVAAETAAAAAGSAAAADTAGAATSTAGVGAHRVPSNPEPIDLLGSAGAPVLKRLAPVLIGMVALFLLRKIFKRKPKPAED